MAGGVSDAEKHRFVFARRSGESLLAPWQPIDGIVRVLEKVRGALVDQGVRHHSHMLGEFTQIGKRIDSRPVSVLPEKLQSIGTDWRDLPELERVFR